MICPSCNTWNRAEALFCKACGFDLSKAPPAPTAPPPAARAVPLRVWWHGLGVFAILVGFVLFLDVALTGRVTWSLVAILSLGFLIGAIMVLQFLASSDRRDRRPIVAGAILLAASVVLLPVAVALQSAPTTQETHTVPPDAAVTKLNLVVSNEAGQVTVRFVDTTAYLVRADVTHVGGLFTSHSAGDVTVTNSTTGDTLSFTINTRGLTGLFFVGGHDVLVSIDRDLSVALSLRSTTGSLSVDILAGVAVRSADLAVNTGGVTFRSVDAAFANGATVRATSTTGSVTIAIDQATGANGTVGVFGTSTTGSVSFTFNHGPDVGARVVAQVTTGSIDIDSTKYDVLASLAYAPSEAGYMSAGLKFQVELTSTTGSIRIG